MVRTVLDMDDEVSLADFVEFWWAEELSRARARDPQALAGLVAKKQSSMRMLQRNHAALPARTGTAGRTHLYRLGDMVEWARSVYEPFGRVEEVLQHRSEFVGHRWHLDRAVAAAARRVGASACRRLTVGSVVVLNELRIRPSSTQFRGAARVFVDGAGPALEHLRSAASALTGDQRNLGSAVVELLDDIPDVEVVDRLVYALTSSLLAGQRPADLVDRVLAGSELAGARSKSGATSADLVELILAAGPPRPGAVVADLASGEGNLLIAAARRAGGEATLIGFDKDPVARAIARCRVHLARLHGTFHLADSLAGPVPEDARADLVLVDPPLEQRSDYRRWLAAAVAACRPQGEAVVALPAITADPRRPEWQEIGRRHASLLIKCPARLRSDQGDALVLWGLRPTPPEKVLILDASYIGERRDTATVIDRQHLPSLHAALEAWAGGEPPPSQAPIVARVVDRDEMEAPLLVEAQRLPGRRGALEGNLFQQGPGQGGPTSEMQEGLGLAQKLEELITGPLRPYTAEHHRRAMRTLIQKLSQLLGQMPDEF